MRRAHAIDVGPLPDFSGKAFAFKRGMRYGQQRRKMNRWIWFAVCAFLGLVMVICGLLTPAHLRAVDASVLQLAGRNSTTLTGRGLDMVDRNNPGAARLLLQSAQARSLPGHEQLSKAVETASAGEAPPLHFGASDPELERLFGPQPAVEPSSSFTDFIVRMDNRQAALAHLAASDKRAVRELLRCRSLTNTLIFPPSQSASGQAFDTALAITGLLLEREKLSPTLADELAVLAANAMARGVTQPLEQALLDFMSLGQRMNWGQLTAFVADINSTGTLRQLAAFVRAGEGVSTLFSTVVLSGNPAGVAGYLQQFSETGAGDLAGSLRFGAGGVNELLERQQRLHSGVYERLAAVPLLSNLHSAVTEISLRKPKLALTLKWISYALGGFLLALALHFAAPQPTALERPLQVRGVHFARELLFALGFVVVVLLLSEPFLGQESQKSRMPFQLRLPVAGGASAMENAGAENTFMNQSNINLLTMLMFFVVHGLLYMSCLVKLAEIRRQRVAPRIKLRLLENEDHLFDAGLYLGFLGTIISFIVYSLWAAHQFSLMVAYSSTSFGIIFVSFFKICHLRPLRRKLLLEAEANYPDPSAEDPHVLTAQP
jgi:hypothetical protein